MLFKQDKSFFIAQIIGCLWASFFLSCSNFKQSDNADINTYIPPNKDSELTLLMRQVYNEADSIKKAIKAGEGSITTEFIAKLEHVHNATPSDPKLKNTTFTAFNELILTEAKSLQSKPENKIEGFNKLVNRCIDCHKTFCPGPIPRIQKLKIAN